MTRTRLATPAGPVIAREAPSGQALSYFDKLEVESIYIMREVAEEAENPVMLCYGDQGNSVEKKKQEGISEGKRGA